MADVEISSSCVYMLGVNSVWLRMAVAVRCGILGGVVPLGLCCCWPWGKGVMLRCAGFVHLVSVGEYQADQKIVVIGGSKLVLNSIRGH